MDFPSKIDGLNNADEILNYYEKFLKMITACYQDKLNSNLEDFKNNQPKSVFEEYMEENEEWWRKYRAGEHDWQKEIKKAEEERRRIWENLKRSDNYSSDDWQKKFTADSKEQFIDNVKFTLRLKSVSEDRLNKKLGVSDWKNEINKHSSWEAAQRRSFEIKGVVQTLAREFTCAYCNRTRDDLYLPTQRDGKKFCSYDHWELWEKENGKSTSFRPKKDKGGYFGAIIFLTLLIIGIIWLVKRKKKT
ncbi:MAG: hypothetical protein MRERV_95c004 [Mycoplasmataceae bacterium RV_VA103A]|nr:MAG: hypothetical protein MRERV_95c004 [Mycoplasmataceae bacterium RV_VA103A]